MRVLRTVMFSAGIFVISFLMASNSAHAWTSEIYGDLTFENMEPGGVVVFAARVITGPGEGGIYTYVLTVAGEQVGNPVTYDIPENDQHAVSYNLFHNNMIPLCSAGSGSIHVNITVTAPDSSTQAVVDGNHPCSTSLISTLPVNPPTLVGINCGPDNDSISIPTTQPEGINPVPTDSGWIGGMRTITYHPLSGYEIAGQTSFTYYDIAVPCGPTPITPHPMIQTPICGDGNDEIMTAQPPGIAVNDTGWVDNYRVITLTAEPGYEIMGQTVYEFWDEGQSCGPIYVVAEPIDHFPFCGDNNDEITNYQPAGIAVNDTGWVDNYRKIILTAEPGYELMGQTEYEFWDEGDCVVESPGGPEQLHVCGDNNDELEFPQLPTGTYVGTDDGWIINTRYVEYFAYPGYELVGNSAFQFSDEGDCVTEPIEEPAVQPVCGDNNDVVTVPDQPEGVVIDSQGTWSGNQRTVQFYTSSGYVFPDGETGERVLNDSGPCLAESIDPPESFAICGNENDAIQLKAQHASIVYVSDGPWENNSYPVVYAPAPNYYFADGVNGTFILEDAGNCVTDPIPEPTIEAVCGDDNDLVYKGDLPEGVLLITHLVWADNAMHLIYVPDTGYVFPDGEDGLRDLIDEGRCYTESPVLPTTTMVCGDNNDEVVAYNQPTHVKVSFNTNWVDNQITVYVEVPDPNYQLPPDTPTEHILVDDGPCETLAPLHPIQTEICGENNDVVVIPDQPENVNVTSNETWNENVWNVTFSAAENYVLPDPDQAEYTLIDQNDPCPTDAPIPPVQTEVCGPNNDIITIPELQPEGVSVESDTDWTDNERKIVFAIDPAFITDGETTYEFIDSNEPCPTGEPIPPVQTEVCGPNNDIITIPELQPEGVSVESDTDWTDNERTVVFTVDPAFVSTGETRFIFTDENVPCPVETVGTVTFVLETSDGGSMEGADFELYSETASQSNQVVYASGVVSADNTAVVEDILPGEYRLVITADGYERIDQQVSINADTTEVTIEAIAVQVPTPEPTQTETPAATTEPSPTPDSIITPTESPEPTVSPTETQAPTQAPTPGGVSGLPDTGSGTSGFSPMTYLGFGFLIAMVAVVGWRVVPDRIRK